MISLAALNLFEEAKKGRVNCHLVILPNNLILQLIELTAEDGSLDVALIQEFFQLTIGKELYLLIVQLINEQRDISSTG
jgi:hypothetical protein